MNSESLSKEISYALRHRPEQYGIDLDEQGWASIEVLILALRKQERFKDVSIDDIEEMIACSQKKRHEIQGGRIRALYGHSVGERINKEALMPPDILYHGTAHKYLASISAEGLVSKNRQYVHLSEDVATAILVGKRRDTNPVVLTVDTRRAWGDGVPFYFGGDGIWLADGIPPGYINFP